MNKILNIVSVLSTFIVVFVALFYIQDITLGRIKFLNRLIAFNFVPLKYLIFTATSLFVILKYVEFYVPKRRKY